MTDQLIQEAPAPPAADARPYDAPTLTPLGSVAALTAGTDSGIQDQILGGGATGGFDDPSS